MDVPRDLAGLARLVGDLVGLEVPRRELAARLCAGIGERIACDRAVLHLRRGAWWYSWTWRPGGACGPARRSARPPAAAGPCALERRLHVPEGGRISFYRRSGGFTSLERTIASALAETAGLVVRGSAVRESLRERVKELSCLYAISQAAHRYGAAEDRMLEDVAAIIPTGFLFPRAAAARLTVDGRCYRTPRRRAGARKLSAPIFLSGQRSGVVEVSYPEGVAEPGEDPFLPDERALVDEIALQVGLALERSRDAEERRRLEGQLRHADRLATLGELAAGIAHEINEPLEGILGFAQLARRTVGLPAGAEADLDRVVSETLRARQIVRQLLLFARQAPSHVRPVEVNAVVRGIQPFLAQRCRAAGVDFVVSLARSAGAVRGDETQLSQVVVNLAVNAIQAMSGGGRLTVRTRGTRGAAQLEVGDTGVGMSPEVLGRIFVPFFTTKAVGTGTGLGLPVVHGIVAAHGGSIAVDSSPGHGSRFTVNLPRAGRGEERTHAGGS